MIPSRTRGICDNRHQIRDPYKNQQLNNTDVWANTLLKTRIPELFKTQQGLPGHVEQLQSELNRIKKVENLSGEIVAHATGVMKRIHGATQKVLEAARKRPDLNFPANLCLQFPLIQNELHF